MLSIMPDSGDCARPFPYFRMMYSVGSQVAILENMEMAKHNSLQPGRASRAFGGQTERLPAQNDAPTMAPLSAKFRVPSVMTGAFPNGLTDLSSGGASRSGVRRYFFIS